MLAFELNICGQHCPRAQSCDIPTEHSGQQRCSDGVRYLGSKMANDEISD